MRKACQLHALRCSGKGGAELPKMPARRATHLRPVGSTGVTETLCRVRWTLPRSVMSELDSPAPCCPNWNNHVVRCSEGDDPRMSLSYHSMAPMIPLVPLNPAAQPSSVEVFPAAAQENEAGEQPSFEKELLAAILQGITAAVSCAPVAPSDPLITLPVNCSVCPPPTADVVGPVGDVPITVQAPENQTHLTVSVSADLESPEWLPQATPRLAPSPPTVPIVPSALKTAGIPELQVETADPIPPVSFPSAARSLTISGA